MEKQSKATVKALVSTPEEIDVASALAGLDSTVPSSSAQSSHATDTNTNVMMSTHRHDTQQRKGPKPKMKLPIEPEIIHAVPKRKDCVNHTYRDTSIIIAQQEPTQMFIQPTSDIAQMSFGEKLHEILSNDEYKGMIEWMPHGRAFRVTVPLVFENVVCMKYFGHKRYSSFLRLLTVHSFKHLTQGPDRNCYYEEFFLRGLPHLCKYMPKPRDSRRLLPDVDNEPDFYALSAKYPLPSDPPSCTQGNEDSQECLASTEANTQMTELPQWYHSIPSNVTSAVCTSDLSHMASLDISSKLDATSLLCARLASQVYGIGNMSPPPKRQAVLPSPLISPLRSEPNYPSQSNSVFAVRLQRLIMEKEAKHQLQQHFCLQEQQRLCQQQQSNQDQALFKELIRQYRYTEPVLLPATEGLNRPKQSASSNITNGNIPALQQLLQQREHQQQHQQQQSGDTRSSASSSSLIDYIRSRSQTHYK